MFRQGLPSDLSPNFSASEEPEGCALLAAGLCPPCGGDSGQGSASLWGAGVRVPLGSEGAVCTAWVCQQWVQGVHARLCGVCEGVPNPPSRGPQLAPRSQPAPLLFPFPDALLVVRGRVVWPFSPSLSLPPSKKY